MEPRCKKGKKRRAKSAQHTAKALWGNGGSGGVWGFSLACRQRFAPHPERPPHTSPQVPFAAARLCFALGPPLSLSPAAAGLPALPSSSYDRLLCHSSRTQKPKGRGKVKPKMTGIIYLVCLLCVCVFCVGWVLCPPFPCARRAPAHPPHPGRQKHAADPAGLSSFFDRPSWSEGPTQLQARAGLCRWVWRWVCLAAGALVLAVVGVPFLLLWWALCRHKRRSSRTADAYGHTMGNAPDPVRFQKLSLIRHPKY